MLRPRLIPTLLIHKGGLVKTVKFANPKYVGDPLNAVRIFNEKEVDELFVADIDATASKVEPNYSLIEKLASECRMPLTYCGGVTNVEQIGRIIGLGVEKVAIGAAAVEDPELVRNAAGVIGNQSIAVVMDVKKRGVLRRYEVVTHNGKRGTGIEPVSFAKELERFGVGELIVNCVDREGTGIGYDLPLIEQIRKAVTVPMTALGGAGDFQHIRELYKRMGTIGAGVGSLFVFKGRFRAVLINYPIREEHDKLSEGRL